MAAWVFLSEQGMQEHRFGGLVSIGCDVVVPFGNHRARLMGEPAMMGWNWSYVFFLGFIAVSTALPGSPRLLAADLAVVGFDVPAIVVAQHVDASFVDAPTTGGKLIRLKIPVSTFLSTEFDGQVTEYVVEIESPHRSLRILDFWPRNEVYSEVEGTVSVESSRNRDYELNLSVSAGAEPIGRGSVGGNLRDKTSVQERYQRKPPMQTLTSSGTIRRGYGVFFKFRPGPLPVAEGSRELAILAEVPPSWRADLLQVTMRAVGQTGSSKRSPQEGLGTSQLWMTTYQEGDSAAAARVQHFLTQERSLRALAASSHDRVREKSLPTWWHKMGAALDIVQPRIPRDYLIQVLFGPSNQYLEGNAHRLPIDLRVAILDFWDARRALTHLAFGVPPETSGVPIAMADTVQ